nr:uncharacterized protein LOC115258675 [Aedes albopictus]
MDIAIRFPNVRIICSFFGSAVEVSSDVRKCPKTSAPPSRRSNSRTAIPPTAKLEIFTRTLQRNLMYSVNTADSGGRETTCGIHIHRKLMSAVSAPVQEARAKKNIVRSISARKNDEKQVLRSVNCTRSTTRISLSTSNGTSQREKVNGVNNGTSV